MMPAPFLMPSSFFPFLPIYTPGLLVFTEFRAASPMIPERSLCCTLAGFNARNGVKSRNRFATRQPNGLSYRECRHVCQGASALLRTSSWNGLPHGQSALLA
eukprot:1160176-Pelagomonas_calceolata.AAC.8